MADPVLPPVPAAVHLMGIGGIGVSGLAYLLLEKGYRVSGCDLTPTRLTDRLAGLGAVVRHGHDAAHIDDIDLLVISSAVRDDNPELMAARERGVPVVKRAGLLATLLGGQSIVAVAGTHGKTTTSALVASILRVAGLDPTAVIGGEVPGLGASGETANARLGRGRWAVAEADEYDASFLRLSPAMAIVTNVEADHLDFYGNVEGVRSAFADFVARLPADGVLIACADDVTTLCLAETASCRVVTYGLGTAADWVARDIEYTEAGTRFTAFREGVGAAHVHTSLSGRHNVANVLGALAASVEAGVPLDAATRALGRFEPPLRRQEVKGYAAGGAIVVDDYAHHPTEIRATLSALRQRFPGRKLRVAYQPHTYSRTRAFLSETGASFDDADEVAVTPIYAAREHDTLGVSGLDVVDAVRAAGRPAIFAPSLDDVSMWLLRGDSPETVLVTLGAGDIWKASERLAVGHQWPVVSVAP